MTFQSTSYEHLPPRPDIHDPAVIRYVADQLAYTFVDYLNDNDPVEVFSAEIYDFYRKHPNECIDDPKKVAKRLMMNWDIDFDDIWDSRDEIENACFVSCDFIRSLLKTWVEKHNPQPEYEVGQTFFYAKNGGEPAEYVLEGINSQLAMYRASKSKHLAPVFIPFEKVWKYRSQNEGKGTNGTN